MASLAKNAVWNTIRVGSNVVFPLITFPYTSRVLGPAVKGEFEYVIAIVAYFILFANLGFPYYGIREVSKNRDNRKELSDTISSIFTANVCSVVITIFLYFIFCIFVFKDNQLLFSIIGITLLLSCIQFDWVYQGVEDFKYITIRSIIIKTLSIIALFIFVRNPEDLIAYAVITVIGEAGNNIFNLLRIYKYADLKFSFRKCEKHIKGASALFLGTIAVSLYTHLNTVMLGALSTKEAVGYFTAGNKMVHLVLTLITAILSAIIPRISYQLGSGMKEKGELLQHKVLKLIVYVSFPLTIGIIFLAKDIILLLAGEQYMSSIPVLIILSGLVYIIPLSNFMGFHVLLPIRKEKYGTYAVLSGAVTNAVLNYALISSYSYIGIAIAVVISELVVTLVHCYFARKYFVMLLREFLPINCIISVIIISLFLFLSNVVYPHFNVLSLFFKIIGTFLLYLFILIVMRDSLCIEILRKLNVKRR